MEVKMQNEWLFIHIIQNGVFLKNNVLTKKYVCDCDMYSIAI